jgi:hypothetical protein
MVRYTGCGSLDEQIERNAATGRPDRFAEEALNDLREGRCTAR